MIFTARDRKRLLLICQSDISDDEFLLDGIKYAIDKKEILPLQTVFDINPVVFWQPTISEPTEDKMLAKSSLRNAIVTAIKAKVPEKEISNMLNIAITYLVLDE